MACSHILFRGYLYSAPTKPKSDTPFYRLKTSHPKMENRRPKPVLSFILFVFFLSISISFSTDTILSLDLLHRDRILPAHSNPTRQSLLRHRLHRDQHRAQSLSSPMISGFPLGMGEYFARMALGTPPKHFYMLADTGSDLIWLQCRPCKYCYNQSDPLFNPTRSTSYSRVRCASEPCRQLDLDYMSDNCTAHHMCRYKIGYGDGSFSFGDLATETLWFGGKKRVPRVALGCGHDNEGLYAAAAGLLGLGPGKLSFPSQARTNFSYCLADLLFEQPNRTSWIRFGSPPATKTQFTPLKDNPKIPSTYYYVGLRGISVGGENVVGIHQSDFEIHSDGSGGTIVDSGTTVSRLPGLAYKALRKAFVAKFSLKPSSNYSLLDTCFDLSGKGHVEVPTVALHFEGGAVMELSRINCLFPVDTNGTYCFAFAAADGVSIIGNIQQQGFEFWFDSAGKRLGFAPNRC
ncbi:eukaryotic aspartyl protease family protein [Striga asiatica]|uniref:Eukaryotic aspartyl protease family protein n=1 Tax=Striga asiatica TaxID=4170 RepID=A0A5A7PYF8_STRAF|nr:eukaryotic aspartyl protease family protein [Striga asiatica]